MWATVGKGEARALDQNPGVAVQPRSDRETRAALLNAIPATGIGPGELAAVVHMDENTVLAGLDRLQQLGLVETHNGLVRPTAFAIKAMKIFKVA